MNCPKCHDDKIVKNGHTHNGKQRFMCKKCRAQFVLSPTRPRISEEKRTFIDKLLLEKISLRGICRVTGVSLSWLQKYVNKKHEKIKEKVSFDRPRGKIALECD